MPETKYKVELAIKDIQRLNDAILKIEVEIAVLRERMEHEKDSLFEKITEQKQEIKLLKKSVSELRDEHLKKKGASYLIKVIFTKYPVVVNLLIIVFLVCSNPDFTRLITK